MGRERRCHSAGCGTLAANMQRRRVDLYGKQISDTKYSVERLSFGFHSFRPLLLDCTKTRPYTLYKSLTYTSKPPFRCRVTPTPLA